MNKNTKDQYIWTAPLDLRTGQTYYYQDISGEFVAVKILKPSRYGEYGARVHCSDGMSRYASGSFSGRNRVDSLTKNLRYTLNPDYIPTLKPHVQLSLFDFETE